MLLDALVNPLNGHAAFDIAECRYRNKTRFFTHDNREAVGLFRNADAGAMPGTCFRRKSRIHTERQEARRGGQSFVVCPRIEDIEPMERRLQELVPDLSLTVVHGRMASDRLDEHAQRHLEVASACEAACESSGIRYSQRARTG